MELKHTPGPWLIDPLKQGTRWNIETTDGDSIAIAHQQVNDKSHAARDANAKLIAAAPEMLEALQELVFLYEHDEGCRELTEYKRAKAAIAKATGH